ncbi:basic amino acid ABC transporter substrate-binding protein [Cohnella endophytica]|uniref:Basic amino acid ABC transporter substrate-binding protein n=1 Tax=Cohnella endophytica TaxID=2419778 RepID=A0A494XH23_9BACL|nr:basic amino acid ABC transporter substrate-binding protein [Cohnella endophytica]RKP50035.1 basic amino acid ABC transporter substrate-binding protein [Cohnella endophytica]
MRKVGLGAIIASLALVLVLSGCGAKNKAAGNKDAAEPVKVYRFASDGTYPPMENMDKDKLVGFDIDFLAAVMEEAGLEYEVKNLGWDALLESVKQGKEYDAGISSITISDDRKKTYDFTIPYFESTNMILTKEGSDIKSAADLKGKKVAVQGATTGDKLMTGIMGEGNKNLKRFESNALALLELSSNGVDAVVADIAIVNEYVKNNPGKKFVGILDRTNFESEYYGIAFPKGSELKELLDPAIKTVLESDTYKEIYAKWIGGEPDMTTLLKSE